MSLQTSSAKNLIFFKTKIVDLANDLSIPANNSPQSKVSDVPLIAGFTPILVTNENMWNGNVTLWYNYLNPQNHTITWRVQNHSNQAVTVTIRVRILYARNDLVNSLV